MCLTIYRSWLFCKLFQATYWFQKGASERSVHRHFKRGRPNRVSMSLTLGARRSHVRGTLTYLVAYLLDKTAKCTASSDWTRWATTIVTLLAMSMHYMAHGVHQPALQSTPHVEHPIRRLRLMTPVSARKTMMSLDILLNSSILWRILRTVGVQPF